MKLTSTFILVILLITFSCQKDDGHSSGGEQQENIPNMFSEYFGSDISRDFLGTVIDKNNLPIEGVTISIGNETAITDSNGVFIIRNADVKEHFGYIKAEKAGYIHGSRSVVPSNGTNKVTIMLLEATVVGSVSSGSSETITANDGSSVSFDGNFIKEDGSTYSGSVDVIIHHLDPSDDDMNLQMPGMLYAENEDGAERMLQTLGMLAVELRGTSGEDLNLAEDSTSEIKIPVDASLMSIAPATIPLWYFDEDNGYWKEEGEATLQGNVYVGSVSHFSFWNVDIPVETTILCVNLINEDGNEINNMRVTLTSTTYGTTTGITNDNGEVCGLVPSNQTLTLNVFNNGICDNIILVSQLTGPLSADSSIDVVVPNNPNVTEDIVTGNFSTCDGEPVSNGYVLLNYEDAEVIGEVNNGNFEISLYRCSESTEFSLIGIDLDNLQSSTEVTYNFITPTTNVGQIISCTNLYYNYVTYQYNDTTIVRSEIDGAPAFWFRCELSETGNTLSAIVDPNTTGPQTFRLTLWDNTNGIEPGNYNGVHGEGNTDTALADLGGSHIFSQIGSGYFRNFEGNAQLIRMGDIGEIVEISFSGIFDISEGPNDIEYLEENVPISGYMYLIRDE
jgi:hypothetical protein